MGNRRLERRQKMEKERLYKVKVDEQCDAHYNGSCEIATVTVKSKSANEAIEKALEKVKNEIESESLFVSTVRCINILTL